jgi:serine/threonine-protein kinase
VPDLIGKKLKDFYVLRRLGRGAMAEVYLAQQLSLGRQVALKVLDAELARDPNYVRRFHHEARSAAALVHAGIVQIYEVGQVDGVHFIAQEYVAGRNLGELIRSQGSLAPHLAVDVLRQVAAALVKAASEGIVHRDIKPENIMVAAATGEVKVADFGLARMQSDHPTSGERGVRLTQAGITMGTPLYMSPEQIEGHQLDSRSDIYSLGVTAYHMLSGKPPFSGDSPLAVAVQHLNQPPPALAVAGLSEPGFKLVRVVERMMAKKPANRYSDPAALLGELNALAVELSREQGAWSKASDGIAPGSMLPAPNLLAEMIHAADERAVAAGQLDDLMKTMAVSREARRPIRWIAAAILGCAVVGAAIAAITRPPSLLGESFAGPPKSEDVWGQIYHAKNVDTEEAWLAVRRYFPDAGEYYHDLAKQGLVYFYLTRSQDYGKAVRPLEELAGSAQPSLQAFGIAGLVVAYAHLGEDENAYDANQRLNSEMRTIVAERAPRMAAMLDDALVELASRGP